MCGQGTEMMSCKTIGSSLCFMSKMTRLLRGDLGIASMNLTDIKLVSIAKGNI